MARASANNKTMWCFKTVFYYFCGWNYSDHINLWLTKGIDVFYILHVLSIPMDLNMKTRVFTVNYLRCMSVPCHISKSSITTSTISRNITTVTRNNYWLCLLFIHHRWLGSLCFVTHPCGHEHFACEWQNFTCSFIAWPSINQRTISLKHKVGILQHKKYDYA